MCFFRKRRAKRKAKKLAKLEAEQKALEKETIAKEPVADKPKVQPKVAPKAKPTPKKAEQEDVKEGPAKYHVSQNKDKKSKYFKQWRVRKEGSSKTIKYHETQAEAIKQAQHFADNVGSSIVIHKLDGTIRKQDYTK